MLQRTRLLSQSAAFSEVWQKSAEYCPSGGRQQHSQPKQLSQSCRMRERLSRCMAASHQPIMT